MADFNEKMQNEIDTNTEETVKINLDEESAQVTAVEGDYGANQIQILEGLELCANVRACTSAVRRLVDYII